MIALSLFLLSLAPGGAPPADVADIPIAAGPFEPTWASLEANYAAPAWFRDAKFGIWAHWGPQCQPEDGDWYARNMYIQGSEQYEDHLRRYGHPSVEGFKDVIHRWHAENFDPAALIKLYKAAGAKYFVALANHHDNLDNFNSKYQPWNSVNVGPHKDLVGMWERAARAAGLKFGVTVHAARAWSWYEVAQGADKTGPYAGVPYDGNLTKADGKGKWWDGLDPQDLYAQNHPIGAKPSAAYAAKFFLRVKQLIDDYKPDLLYFDDWKLPLLDYSDEVGLKLAAHYYNSSVKAHGRNEAVMTTKGLAGDERKAFVWDIERGLADQAEGAPWQTDTCIGDWHYQRKLYLNHGYKKASEVIPTLLDIVSKNGNLLLNIPVRSDGTIDPDEVAFLKEMATWIKPNGEAIFGTRPWRVFGEGPASKLKGSDFNEGVHAAYTGEDIRFTRKGNTLYAALLGWPGTEAVIRSIRPEDGVVKRVAMLGKRGGLAFRMAADGLHVTLPAEPPSPYANVLRIEGLKLGPAS